VANVNATGASQAVMPTSSAVMMSVTVRIVVIIGSVVALVIASIVDIITAGYEGAVVAVDTMERRAVGRNDVTAQRRVTSGVTSYAAARYSVAEG
jgi:hypothetical protein